MNWGRESYKKTFLWPRRKCGSSATALSDAGRVIRRDMATIGVMEAVLRSSRQTFRESSLSSVGSRFDRAESNPTSHHVQPHQDGLEAMTPLRRRRSPSSHRPLLPLSFSL